MPRLSLSKAETSFARRCDTCWTCRNDSMCLCQKQRSRNYSSLGNQHSLALSFFTYTWEETHLPPGRDLNSFIAAERHRRWRVRWRARTRSPPPPHCFLKRKVAAPPRSEDGHPFGRCVGTVGAVSCNPVEHFFKRPLWYAIHGCRVYYAPAYIGNRPYGKCPHSGDRIGGWGGGAGGG